MTITFEGKSRRALETISAMPDTKQWRSSRAGKMEHCSRVIGPTSVEGMTACPCCNLQLKEGRQTLGEIRVSNGNDSLFKDDCSDTDIEDLDEEDHMMPGVLADGAAYTVRRSLVQGWVHKKGTGMDWLGSRAWKPRWAVLVLARLSGHEAEVPLLQIFWHPSSPAPSTVVHLDSSVLLPEDDSDQSKWNCYRFEIRHVKKSIDESSIQVTRVFSCPREGRDAWVYAINQALLAYEKEKASARRNSSLPLSAPRNSLTWANRDGFQSQRKSVQLTPTPPTSPRTLPFKRPAPRPEPRLIGEALMGQGGF